MPSYNHYTPQSDGSYRRSTVQDSARKPGPRPPYPAQQTPPQKPQPSRPPEQKPQEPSCDDSPSRKPEPPCTQSQDQGVLSFLRGLLPRQIDAADLLVISLLLLMNREEDDGGLSPLLTIALYFLL